MATQPGVPADLQRLNGRWGEVFINGLIVAEAVSVDFTIEITQDEVPQVGGAWTTFMEGTIRGTGTLNLVKAYSGFERLFLDYVQLTKTDLAARRASGTPVRPKATMNVIVDDPLVGTESVTLGGVKFWSMTGGFDLTALINRAWAFTFTSASLDTPLPGGPDILGTLQAAESATLASR